MKHERVNQDRADNANRWRRMPTYDGNLGFGMRSPTVAASDFDGNASVDSPYFAALSDFGGLHTEFTAEIVTDARPLAVSCLLGPGEADAEPHDAS